MEQKTTACERWIRFVESQTCGAGYRTAAEYQALLCEFNRRERGGRCGC